ncbi:ankycorbin-like isoform X2 [Lineus longissimus]|uniref:ankycorbin-like isoform X2 n=1 Tax=Lineus longissimus TaxID=88925 RepID=UPI00315DA30E
MPGKKGLFKLKKSASAPNVSLEWSKHDDKLLHAVEQAHREKVESLINKKGLNPTKLNHQGQSAFHEAATRGQNGILDICIKHGADVQAADAQGRTALHLAARHGRNETLVKLIKAGIPVSAIDLCQMMPIHHACLGGHIACVNSLISKESPLNPEDKDKRTPLFFAAEMGEAIVCRELIDKGVNINAQDFCQMTALMCAAQQGHTDVVDLFVKRGANVKLIDSQGHTAAWYALEGGHTTVKQIIDEAPTMAAWDVCAPEEPDKQDETEVAPEVQEDENASLPDDDAERVDFIAQFTVDSSPSPVASKRSHAEANLGEIIFTDEENAPSSHESYPEIARKPDTDTTPESVTQSHDLTKAYQELVEDNEAMMEEFSSMKHELKKVQNKNSELQRRLENKSPPPTQMDTAVVEALEMEISELQKQLQRTKVTKLAESGEKKRKQDLDDSWNDSEDEQDFSGSYDKPASSESGVDRQLVPMLRSQILTLQKENDELKHKIKKIPNGDLGGSSDEEEGPGVTKLDVNILNGDKVTSLSHQDFLALNKRIQELEKTNKQYLRQMKDLQESSNNNTDVNFGAEISGVSGSVVEGLKIEELKIKNEGLKDLNEALKNTTDDLKDRNDQLLIDVGRLKVEFDSADREREIFRKQLSEIAKFGNSEEEGTDVLKFFHEINNLKRENTDLVARNDQLEEEIEQLLKQRTADHKVQGVLPDESVGRPGSVVEEVIFGVQAGNVESGVSLDASPYESHWAAGARTQKIYSLRQDNEELQVRIKELTDQKMELESNAEDMSEEISHHEALIQELQNTNRHYEKECSSVKQLCENLELENKKFRVEIGEKEAKESEMKEQEIECGKLQDNHEAITFVLDETKRHVEILAKENEEYKARVTALEAENVSTCESLKSEAMEEIEKLNNQIDILQKEKETYQERLDEFDRKLQKKNNRISSLVQTIEELKRGSSMLHSSKNDVEDQMGDMHRDIETLKYENEELEKTVARLMKRGSEEESIKLSIAKSTSMPADDATVLGLEKELERLKKKVKKLEDCKKEYEEEIEEFAETNQSNFDQCTQLCEELGTLKGQYDLVVNQKTTSEEHLQQSEEERERLQGEISIKKQSIKELKAHSQTLTVQNEDLTDAVTNLREECLKLEADKDQLSQDIQTLRANMDVVSVSEGMALSAVPNVDGAVHVGKHDEEDKEEVLQLRDECSDLKQINSELRVRAQSVTKVQDELFDLQEDNDRLIGEVEKSKEEMAALLSENQTLKEKCEISGQNSFSGSGEQEKWETEKSDLQNDVQNLQDKIVILSHEMNLLTKSNAKLTGDCEGYLQQTACLEDERDVAVKERETLLKINETLQSQLEELEKENLELEKERLNLSDYEKLKENMSVLEEEKCALLLRAEELKQFEMENTQLNIDLCELKSAQVKSDRKVKDLSTQNDELRTEVVQLSQIANSRVPEEQTSQQVKQAVQDAERKIKKLQDEVKRLKKHIKEADLKHREVVATYRTHLLSAVQGQMDGEIVDALRNILTLRTKTNTTELINTGSSCC